MQATPPRLKKTLSVCAVFPALLALLQSGQDSLYRPLILMLTHSCGLRDFHTQHIDSIKQSNSIKTHHLPCCGLGAMGTKRRKIQILMLRKVTVFVLRSEVTQAIPQEFFLLTRWPPFTGSIFLPIYSLVCLHTLSCFKGHLLELNLFMPRNLEPLPRWATPCPNLYLGN